ncbi:MAG: hypothetical protein JXB39_02140 [Deltaproteobacteria bacterium]|nr:hypothetical protein [Deltaproteobacteria bacterium]
MHARLPLLPVLLVACACAPRISEEAAIDAVMKAFHESDPPGRSGVELLGRSVWLRADLFDGRCLEEKNLAFTDSEEVRPDAWKGVPHLSPTYENQRFLTAPTEKGWCVLLGENPTLTLTGARREQGVWRFSAIYGMEKPTPWFECLDRTVLERSLEVGIAHGRPEVIGSVALFDDACPTPMPGGEVRTGRPRPTSLPPQPPSRQEVRTLLQAFDDALSGKDHAKALDLVSCYNPFEPEPWGACSVAEILRLAPLPRGRPENPDDGPPWLEYVMDDVGGFSSIVPDARDRTLFHVKMPSRRGSRSLAVQWVDGAWKVVGVVGAKAEDLTTMRIVYDLDRPEKRAIFERRLRGELIDEKGCPIDPRSQ